jgi:hypothetical protein
MSMFAYLVVHQKLQKISKEHDQNKKGYKKFDLHKGGQTD